MSQMNTTPLSSENPPSYEEAVGLIPLGSTELRVDSLPILVHSPPRREEIKRRTYITPIIVLCSICLLFLAIMYIMY